MRLWKKQRQEITLSDVAHRIVELESAIHGLRTEVRQERHPADRGELAGKLAAYVDGFYFGREYLLDGIWPHPARLESSHDILDLFRSVVDLTVQRYYRIEELRKSEAQLKQEISKLQGIIETQVNVKR